MSTPLIIDGKAIQVLSPEVEKQQLVMLEIAMKDGNFVIPVGQQYPPDAMQAFTHLIREDLFRLYDVNNATARANTGQIVEVPARYFQITQKGRFRLNELREKAKLNKWEVPK